MGRKKYAAEILEWTINQGIEVALVCTDSQFPNSPTAQKAGSLGIPVVSIEEAENYINKHPDEIDLVVSYLYWKKITKTFIDEPSVLTY